MSLKPRGELVPTGGGDTIALTREVLTIGRRESCDICMRFPNVSSVHAELSFRDGYWYIRDLNSTNGIKVNGTRVMEKLLHPRDQVTIAKRTYVIQYEMPANRNAFEEVDQDEILTHSLLERAGLERRKQKKSARDSDDELDAAEFLLEDEE